MSKCKNPECKKNLPEGKVTCNEDCMRRYYELKKEERPNLESEPNLWIGQGKRKNIMEAILKLARENLPMNLKKFSCLVSFRTNLSLRKVTEDYLEILIELGVLKLDVGVLSLNEAEPYD